MADAITCPNCKLLNPPNTQVCDCGAIIGKVSASERLEVEYLSAKNRSDWKIKAAAATAGAIFVGYFVFRVITKALIHANSGN